MATKYWFGGTGSWDSGTAHWSLNSGDSPSSPTTNPTATDDVVFDAASNATAYTVTVTASSVCANCTVGNPLAGVITWGSGAGSLAVSGNLVLAAGMTMTWSGTLTMKQVGGTSTITSNGIALKGAIILNGSGTTFQLVDNLTLSALTSGFTLTAGTFDAATNSRTVTFTGAGVATITPTVALSFYNLTHAPASPGKIAALTLKGDITVTNQFTTNEGATVTNRVLVQSSVKGTQRTITAAAVSISNADFLDIIGAGAASWDMSAATGGSGNCGNNSMKALGDAAFTTATNTTFVMPAASANWSTVANWSVRVPLPQDTALFGACGTAKVLTQDMPRTGGIDFTSATWTTSFTFTMSTTCSVFGSFKLLTGMTLGAGTQTYTFEGRGNSYLDSAGLTFVKTISTDSVTGTLFLSSNLLIGATNQLYIKTGTFSAVNGVNNYEITAGIFNIATGATLTMGSGTHTLLGTSGNVLLVNASANITASTGTIKFTGALTEGITFSGGGKGYNNVWFSNGTSAQTITLTGANSFAEFKDDGTENHTIIFPNVTTTVTSWNVNGAAGKLITLARTGASGTWTISDSSGTNTSSRLSISNSTATGGATWDVSDGTSTDGGGNTGWVFSAVTSNIKSYNTNVYANIKTINTNAIANVKTLDTNTNT